MTDHRGPKIKADLETLLRAGKTWLPDKAEALSRNAEQLAQLTATFDRQSSLAHDPPSLEHALQVNDALIDAMARCTKILDDGCHLLVEAALRFAHTDATAADEMRKLRKHHPALTDMPVPKSAPVVPVSHAAAPGDPLFGPVVPPAVL